MTGDHSQTTPEGSATLPSKLPHDLKVSDIESVDQEGRLVRAPNTNNESVSQWPFALESHKYVREMLVNADNKAQRYIAFSSAFLVWLSTTEIPKIWSMPIKEWRTLDALYMASILGMSFCVLFSLVTILPRLKGSRKGILYFNSVAEYETSNEFLTAVQKCSDRDLLAEELRHVFELSKICKKKFSWLVASVWSGGAGLVAGILYSILR
jgi:hypothetical protein